MSRKLISKHAKHRDRPPTELLFFQQMQDSHEVAIFAGVSRMYDHCSCSRLDSHASFALYYVQETS